MDNQHKKINGYRDLSQEEIDLMNRIKEQGECLGSMLHDLEFLLPQNDDRDECIAYATKDLKQGIMWAVRAVALPQSF